MHLFLADAPPHAGCAGRRALSSKSRPFSTIQCTSFPICPRRAAQLRARNRRGRRARQADSAGGPTVAFTSSGGTGCSLESLPPGAAERSSSSTTAFSAAAASFAAACAKTHLPRQLQPTKSTSADLRRREPPAATPARSPRRAGSGRSARRRLPPRGACACRPEALAPRLPPTARRRCHRGEFCS